MAPGTVSTSTVAISDAQDVIDSLSDRQKELVLHFLAGSDPRGFDAAIAFVTGRHSAAQ